MAREIIRQSAKFSKKDTINSRNGYALKDVENGEVLTVTACAQMTNTDEETGELKYVTVLVTPEKEYYTAISAMIYDAAPDLIDMLDDVDSAVEIKVGKRNSKAGREFLTMTIL